MSYDLECGLRMGEITQDEYDSIVEENRRKEFEAKVQHQKFLRLVQPIEVKAPTMRARLMVSTAIVSPFA